MLKNPTALSGIFASFLRRDTDKPSTITEGVFKVAISFSCHNHLNSEYISLPGGACR